jgi:hypothetical protein
LHSDKDPYFWKDPLPYYGRSFYTMEATSGAGTACIYRALEFTPVFFGTCCSIFTFLCTACGQKWFRFCHLLYIFHIKPLIFITFSWSHSLADFHEIFTFKNRINFICKQLWFKHKCKFLTSQFYMIIY